MLRGGLSDPRMIQIDIPEKFGSLMAPDIKVHRQYFEELVNLLGIKCIYYAPRPDKHYTNYTEIVSTHQPPEVVGCIFDEYPTQTTLKKMQWVSELQEGASLIHVPYDLHDIQAGALFAIPSGLDTTKGRLFKVTQLTNTMMYPASITCEIVPEYENQFPISKFDHKKNNFNLLAEDDEEC